MVLVSGEISADCYVDIPQVVRNTIKNIGYVGSNAGGFDADSIAVLTSIDEQSADIALGVDKAFNVTVGYPLTLTHGLIVLLSLVLITSKSSVMK